MRKLDGLEVPRGVDGIQQCVELRFYHINLAATITQDNGMVE